MFAAMTACVTDAMTTPETSLASTSTPPFDERSRSTMSGRFTSTTPSLPPTRLRRLTLIFSKRSSRMMASFDSPAGAPGCDGFSSSFGLSAPVTFFRLSAIAFTFSVPSAPFSMSTVRFEIATRSMTILSPVKLERPASTAISPSETNFTSCA